MKKITTLLFVLVYALSIYSQSAVFGEVRDAFLKTPLPKTKVSLLLAKDSTVVVDSIPLNVNRRDDGTLHSTTFFLELEKKTCKYLLRASLDGYEDAWQSVSIDAEKEGIWGLDDPMELQRMRQTTLREVAVTATKVKMYYKGDTLVYNADAFNLPDGSMLDDLIRQLPGVTMNEHGEIFVNGRKIEELLLGSRSFMNGNKEVLMKNLPYYTVKNLQVYEKQSEQSEALGRDVEERRYVMDVNLKKEYSVGVIGNVEGAGGTQKRWLGRGFLLGFTDKWRYSLMGNANNVNEKRHIGGTNHWTPASMPQSLTTTRSVAANLNYHNKEKKLTNDLTVDFTSASDEAEMRQHYTQFLDGSSPTSLTENLNLTDNWNVSAVNEVKYTKGVFLLNNTRFNYGRGNSSGLSQFQQWDSDLTATMRTDNLGKLQTLLLSNHAQGSFNINKSMSNFFALYFRHYQTQSWNSARYDTWQASTRTNEISHNADDVSNKYTNLLFMDQLSPGKLFGKIDTRVRVNFDYADERSHDYLYHPDTLLLSSQLDMLTAITDPSNSYDSHLRKFDNKVAVSLMEWGNQGFISYQKWGLTLELPVQHHSLDYHRAAIDTLINKTWVFFNPSASYNYRSPDKKHNFKLEASYNADPVELLDLVAFRDDRQPLVVKEGNPDLKNKARTNASADYTRTFGKNASQWHIGSTFNYHHRDVAQSVTYNPTTAVYTYKPMNISGAYNITTKFDISSNIDEKRYWTWQMNADAGYLHSVDHAMLAGETESHENAVNTLTLHDGAYIQYNKEALNIRATGDIRWRHSEGRMRDFKTLNATDFSYGMSARYTIPVIKTTLSVDGNMYSRRGYGSKELNTNDFVLNASISQSFLKGKLIARVEGFDLLHQLSSTQYKVDAQGRTETWYRSLPHYAMMHLVFHFNKNPKK